MRATVVGGDNVKNRLHDILLQNGKDAFLAARAGWELFFSSCENIKILKFPPPPSFLIYPTSV